MVRGERGGGCAPLWKDLSHGSETASAQVGRHGEQIAAKALGVILADAAHLFDDLVGFHG